MALLCKISRSETLFLVKYRILMPCFYVKYRILMLCFYVKYRILIPCFYVKYRVLDIFFVSLHPKYHRYG